VPIQIEELDIIEESALDRQLGDKKRILDNARKKL
jgi:hypothetical protein